MPCSHSHKSVHSECSQEGINFIQVSLPFWQMSFWLAVLLSICPSTGLRGQLYSATLPLKLDHGSVIVSNKSHACNYVSMPYTQCWFHWCLFIKEPPYLPARDYFCFIQNLALYTPFWFKKNHIAITKFRTVSWFTRNNYHISRNMHITCTLLLSHPSILGVTLCFCTGSYVAAVAATAVAGSAASCRFLFTR